MEDLAVKRLGLILSVQAMTEQLKIENIIAIDEGRTPPYAGHWFVYQSEELNQICNANEHQLDEIIKSKL